MAAVDLAAASHNSGELPVSGEWDESDLYEPAASTLGSRYKRVVRSKSFTPAVDRHPNSELKVVKLEVKPQPTGRSGLLAAQLKGYADFRMHLTATALLSQELTAAWPLQICFTLKSPRNEYQQRRCAQQKTS